MTLHLIVYASLSLIPPAYADQEVADIVNIAQARNQQNQVTGALVYSEHRRFAQALEGEEQAVRSIMRSISRDRRHHGLVTLYDGPLGERMFRDWSLAYRGDAPSIDYLIRDAQFEANAVTDKALRELLETMRGLVCAPG